MAKNNIWVERGKRLQDLRKKAGLTRVVFAKQTGTSASSLKALELGDREMSTQKATLFSNLFSNLYTLSLGEDAHKASFNFLYHGKEEKVPEKDKLIHDYEDGRIQNDIQCFAANSAHITLKIQNNLMAPFYNEGDVVGGRKIFNKNQFPLYQGHVCIIEDLTENKFLRRIIKSENKKITCCILNTNASQSSPIVEEINAQSIAQAIWHWHLSELVDSSVGVQ